VAPTAAVPGATSSPARRSPSESEQSEQPGETPTTSPATAPAKH
jgi:hypothetical protein